MNTQPISTTISLKIPFAPCDHYYLQHSSVLQALEYPAPRSSNTRAWPGRMNHAEWISSAPEAQGRSCCTTVQMGTLLQPFSYETPGRRRTSVLVDRVDCHPACSGSGRTASQCHVDCCSGHAVEEPYHFGRRRTRWKFDSGRLP